MKNVQPEVTPGAGRDLGSETHKHPAFGVLTVTKPQGGDGAMFGSDVPHYGCIRVEVRAAELRRDLSRDWIHGQDHLVAFELTHAQWAEFISSVGNGAGTPCTLRFRETAGVLPGIEKVQTKYDTHRQEISDAAERRLQKAMDALRAISASVDSGKTGKTHLRPLIDDALRELDQLPGSVAFVLKSAEQALEKATTDAAIEVESYISASAQRVGFETMQELADALRQQARLT